MSYVIISGGRTSTRPAPPRDHYLPDDPPPRKRGWYHYGTDIPFNEAFESSGHVLCILCSRLNRNTEIRPPSALETHLLSEHGCALRTYIKMCQGQHGFDLDCIAEYVP